MSDSLQHHGLQHARFPCPSPTPGVYSISCAFSRWCHPNTSSSVNPFSSHLQSFPASGSFPMNRFFEWGGQSNGVSASQNLYHLSHQGSPMDWSRGHLYSFLLFNDEAFSSLSLKYGGIKQTQDPIEVKTFMDPRCVLFYVNTILYHFHGKLQNLEPIENEDHLEWKSSHAGQDSWVRELLPSHHGVCRPFQTAALALSPSCPCNCDRLFCY